MHELARAGHALRARIRDAWWMLLAQGVLALLVGALLLTNTDASLREFAPFLGAYWLAGGAFDILEALSHREDTIWRWSVLGGALGVLAGLLWFSRIVMGAATLPLWLSALIGLAAIASGAANTLWAWRLRCRIEGEGWIMLWGAVSAILGVWVLGAPFISSDVWILIAALCALVSGAGMVMWVFALLMQRHRHRPGFPRWLIIGATVALAVASSGVWLFGQLRLASSAPAGVPLSESARRGQQVFQLHCAACHNTGAQTEYGPGLAGLFQPGGPRLPAGVDYGGKLPNGKDITPASVAEWLHTGGRGQVGIMPPAAMAMSDSEVADVIEFLKVLER